MVAQRISLHKNPGKSSFSLLDQIKRPMDGADENPDQKEKMETR